MAEGGKDPCRFQGTQGPTGFAHDAVYAILDGLAALTGRLICHRTQQEALLKNSADEQVFFKNSGHTGS